MLSFFMIAVGATIMYAGVPALVDYYVTVEGISPAVARQVLSKADRIVAAFIIFGGALGAAANVAALSNFFLFFLAVETS